MKNNNAKEDNNIDRSLLLLLLDSNRTEAVKGSDVIDSQEFWLGFENFLKRTNNYRSTKDRVNYAPLCTHTSEMLE
jgi:hypothetical protein